MQYIYDIMLNFNDCYYEFYEWKKRDKLINVKKIPLYKVNCDVMYDFMYNDVCVDKKFLDNIFELTLFYKKLNYKYMCLFSDGNKSIGLMFNEKGEVINRSSLTLEEDDEVNDESYLQDVTDICYDVKKRNSDVLISRIEKDRYDYLYKYINKLNVIDDYTILRYIYYDYFEEENDDAEDIKKKLLNVIENMNDNRLYDIVKVFKKIKN